MNYQEVVVRVLPTNFQQRETLVVELAADTVNVLILGRRRTNTKDARDLMLTAVWISSSLGQPLRIEGECKENAAVQAMIAASR